METTTALRKISSMRKRIRMIRGGQGAGKTISILMLICNSASSNAGRNWLIASEELTKMRDSVIADLEAVLKGFGIWQEERWNKSEFVYTFPNGSIIKFRSLDKADAGKGVRTFYGVYFNEINKIGFESYNQYASRCKVVIGDWNPDDSFFVDDHVLPREDCEFLQLTFRDNEMLDETEKREILYYEQKGYKDLNLPPGEGKGQRYHKDNIKDSYWANKWQVYGLGNIGSLIGAVFNNWEIIEEIPKEAKLRSGGMDFGFVNDPTAIVSVYTYKEFIIVDEECYETEMSNKKIAEKIKKSKLALARIYADSAEPKSIDELRKEHRLRVQGVNKGSDSVRFGIDRMQEKRYLITSRSKNVIREFRNYVWQVDRNGKSTNTPQDKNNHAIDAIRYEEMGHNKFNGQYIVR